MIYGYMRVSTTKRDDEGQFVQSFDLQRNALLDAGVSESNIFEDRISGVKSSRPGLDALMKTVQAGDTILIWKLDRLGRSVRNLTEIAETCKASGVGIRSIQDGIDTCGNLGGFLLNILAAMAELERENIRDRVTAGMTAAKRNGKHLGRLPKLSPSAREDVISSVAAGSSALELARRYRVSRSTIYQIINTAQTP